MNTYSHILLGRILCSHMHTHYGIKLDRRSFVLGNVLPDYYPSFLLRPHFQKNNARYIQKTLRQLVSCRGVSPADKRMSRLLGILCHFYADTLCLAHNDDYTGTLADHYQYEKSLHSYFMEHSRQIGAYRFIIPSVGVVKTSNLYRQFRHVHARYLLAQRCYASDLMYAMMACVQSIAMICEGAAFESLPILQDEIIRLAV